MDIRGQSLVRMPDGEWTPWDMSVRQAANR
jgi:hypothetical protein